MEQKIERFTYAGLVNEAKYREKHSNCRGESSRTKSTSFTETESFEEAYEFAIKGWDLGLKEYEIEDGVLASGSTDLNPSLAGAFPHVQNHIIGRPESMYSLYDNREYNLPTLDIIVNIAFLGYIDGSDSLAFSKSMVSWINAKASTRNIRITGVIANTFSHGKTVELITLKEFDEPLIINNIAFAFHPSFFRRFWFGVIEGRSYWSSGYGAAISNYKKLVEAEITTEKVDERLFFKSLMALDSNQFDWVDKDIPDITF